MAILSECEDIQGCPLVDPIVEDVLESLAVGGIGSVGDFRIGFCCFPLEGGCHPNRKFTLPINLSVRELIKEVNEI